jgi:hypothetical protein
MLNGNSIPIIPFIKQIILFQYTITTVTNKGIHAAIDNPSIFIELVKSLNLFIFLSRKVNNKKRAIKIIKLIGNKKNLIDMVTITIHKRVRAMMHNNA